MCFNKRFIDRWTVELFKKGSRHGITKNDLFPPLASDKSKSLTDYLERYTSSHYFFIAP